MAITEQVHFTAIRTLASDLTPELKLDLINRLLDDYRVENLGMGAGGPWNPGPSQFNAFADNQHRLARLEQEAREIRERGIATTLRVSERARLQAIGQHETEKGGSQ